MNTKDKFMEELAGQKEVWIQGYIAALKDIKVMIEYHKKICNFSTKIYKQEIIDKIDMVIKKNEKDD